MATATARSNSGLRAGLCHLTARLPSNKMRVARASVSMRRLERRRAGSKRRGPSTNAGRSSASPGNTRNRPGCRCCSRDCVEPLGDSGLDKGVANLGMLAQRGDVERRRSAPMTTAPTAIPNCPSRTGTRSTCCGSNDGACRDQTADGCPAEPAASRRARQAGVAGHAWAATAPRGPSVDVSERQMGLRRLGTESSPDFPLEGSGFRTFGTALQKPAISEAFRASRGGLRHRRG